MTKRALLTLWTLCCLLAGPVPAAEVEYEKAVSDAVKAGDLAKAKQFCEAWAEKKPTDDQPHIMLGRMYVKQDMIDRAIEEFETARELNPLNPEPICEVGRIFLNAGKAQEAIAEFQAALEVRRDYAPALKGLEDAKDLLENPYREGVSVKLGELNEERGLRQVDWRPNFVSRVVTIGGRQCRATDKASDNVHLGFDVDDAYLFDVDLPVRVSVQYYDLGTGYFLLIYDSTDTSANNHGTSKVAGRVVRMNTRTWKSHTFNLPDARFAKRAWRADFVLSSEAWRGHEDLYVSSVHVVQGGLAVSVEPKVAVADGTCTVTANVVDQEGPVPDGTTVHFSTDVGGISAEVKTTGGEAKATFNAGPEAREATISVETGKDRRLVSVPILHGRGSIVQRRLVLDRFDEKNEWQVSGTESTRLTVAPAPEQERDGRASTHLVYKLRQDDVKSYVSMSRPIPLPGRPVRLGLWAYLDGSPNSLRVELVDATGQIHAYQLGYMTSIGWRWMEHDIGTGMYHHSGANDGRLHLPLRFHRLILRRYYGHKPRKSGGEIYLQDLTVVTDVPESDTVLLDVRPSRPDLTFQTGQDVVLHASLSNLTDEALPGRLRWVATDHENQVVAHGHTDETQVQPHSRISRDITLRPTKPGAYRATVTLETGDENEPAALTEDIAFVLLSEMTDLAVSVEPLPMASGVAARLSSRSPRPTQFRLTYCLTNEKMEVLRKGALGQPNMALKAGEVVECRLSLDGLPVGRYSILLLFDTPDGQRSTSVLSHEVFPRQAALGGRVTDQAGKAIAGASIRARLARRRDPSLSIHDETIRISNVQTDKAGEYTLLAAAVPTDAASHNLYIDVTATGFVDKQQGHSLSRLLRSRARPRTIPTMRLKRGVELAGRVVGADGQPVPDARVHVLCVEPRANRSPWFHWYTPRRTDAEGRFEVSVVPGVAADLIVYSSQGAATRATIPAGQQGDAEIQLESGTRVSGTLLDEHGQPAEGYWVVAESADREGSRRRTGPLRVAAKTGPDGAFELAPLKGRFTIWTPASFSRWWTEPAEHSPRPRLAVLPVGRTFDGAAERVELDLRASPQVRVAGRVTDVDGRPAQRVGVMLYCNLGWFRQPLVLSAARTGEDGRFDLEGIPKGVRDVIITAPTIRSWKRKERIYLRAKALARVTGAHGDGAVRLAQIQEDLPNVDFQFQFWSRTKGFLGTSPDPALMEDAAPGKALDEPGTAPHELAERLAQGSPLLGRVLDEAGSGVRGAQIRILSVRRPKDGEVAKEKVTGPWEAVTGADGRYACAAVPVPKDAKQYSVRLEIVAKGYAKKQQDFPLPKLLTSGLRRLRVPDLRLKMEAGQ